MNTYDNEWYKKNKCHGCHYEYTCYGINRAEVRAACAERRIDGTRCGDTLTPKWGEMSYNRLRPMTNAERIKKGE